MSDNSIAARFTAAETGYADGEEWHEYDGEYRVSFMIPIEEIEFVHQMLGASGRLTFTPAEGGDRQ